MLYGQVLINEYSAANYDTQRLNLFQDYDAMDSDAIIERIFSEVEVP